MRMASKENLKRFIEDSARYLGLDPSNVLHQIDSRYFPEHKHIHNTCHSTGNRKEYNSQGKR